MEKLYELFEKGYVIIAHFYNNGVETFVLRKNFQNGTHEVTITIS
jgi:uncharacterized protein YheU (UPF0270 family)